MQKGRILGLIGATLLFAMGGASAASGTLDYQVTATWGSIGSGPGQFDRPYDIATGPDGSLYVTDLDNHRVQVFSPCSGVRIDAWGGFGSGNGQFKQAYGIGVDRDGYVYVSDLHHRVQKFRADGTYVTQWGQLGSGPGQFNVPKGIGADSQGHIYVLDHNNHRVQKFTNTGGFLLQWGGLGSGSTQLDNPEDLVVGPDDFVYVTDRHNDRIQKFDTSGNLVASWSSLAPGETVIWGAVCVATDEAGHVYVSDYYNHNIKKFTTAGVYLGQVGSVGTGLGQFNQPTGMSVTALGKTIHVVDNKNARVQRLDLAGSDAQLYTSQAAWEMVVGTTYVTQGTAASALLNASEVTTTPSGETALGGTLTFVSGSTTWELQTLQTGAEFIYNDHAQNPSFADHLSVGNVDTHEDDDFRLTIVAGAPVYALAIEIGENDFGDSGETLRVYGTQGNLLASCFDPLSLPGGASFFGVVASEPIGWIELDEHPGDDDIWITNVRISSYAPNASPVADAGVNLAIDSLDQSNTVITGSATDPDSDALTFRWLEGTTVLAASAPVTGGSCPLDLGLLASLSLGEHTLTLEVSDGLVTVTDSLILAVSNSAPTAAPTGAGVFELGPANTFTLGGQVADFDGDLLSYEFRKQGLLTPIASGTIATEAGGTQATLPDVAVATTTLGLGVHTIELEVDDGVSVAVVASIEVEIIDTTAPTLGLDCSRTILWPPNHEMLRVTIETHATDEGGAVVVTATASSNEPINGTGDGDTGPDWNNVVIDANGRVTLDLRAERSGSGTGRVYTITVTATDGSGNDSIATCEVVVPHSKGKKK